MPLIVKRTSVGLYTKALIRLFDGYNKILPNSKVSYLPFKKVNEILGRNFNMPKAEIMEYLQIFNEFGYISFVKFKGVRLEYLVK